MTIYVCERYHDVHCGIYATIEAALAHLDACRFCEITEYELNGNEFEQTGKSVEWLSCENCSAKWRTDKASSFGGRGEYFCSLECETETREFYDNGGVGIHGKNTRQMKQHIIDSMAEGKDPMSGCYGTHSKELTWCPCKSLTVILS